MLSFWEKESFSSYDYIVIGSGIVGLSTAAALAEKNPNSHILVLERGILPTGASTKNAGFACFGSLTEILDDLQSSPENEVLTLVERRWQGLQMLRKRLGDRAIDFQNLGGYELLGEKHLASLEHIEKINSFLKPIFKEPVFEIRNEKIKAFGFDQNDTKALIFNRFEGQIDTGKMMSNLLNYVQSKGVRIWTGAKVLGFEESEKNVMVKIENSFSKENITLKTNQLAICTNAFTKDLIPDLDIRAGRGLVLATAPIPTLPFEGTFHMDEGYYYFRNFGKRVIFGGGRNLDFETETTTEMAINERIRKDLLHKLHHIILPNFSPTVTDWWAGIMAFGESKKPIVKRHSDRVVLGVRMGGMGVALGSLVGAELAEMLEKN